jgi:hypothetical protein
MRFSTLALSTPYDTATIIPPPPAHPLSIPSNTFTPGSTSSSPEKRHRSSGDKGSSRGSRKTPRAAFPLDEHAQGAVHAYNELMQKLGDHFYPLQPSLSRTSFRLQDTLGTGTFGRVRLASYDIDGETHFFALKMLKKTEIIRLKQVEHIKAEKRILSKIFHPFIVNMFSWFKDESHLYMLLEYVIGGELFSQLRQVGRFANDTALFYAAEIVLAFEHLHQQDIVYRDLKPENILIDRQGHIKVADFGFAKEVGSITCSFGAV